MSILGSLIVNLTANTASFIDGMSGASKSANRAARDIESSFDQLGSIANRVLAPFGDIGNAIGNTLGSIGSAAGGTIANLGKMGGAMASVGALAAGAVAAGVVALDAGIIGIALHAAESAERLNELSKQTGLSVETLSGLAFVGRQVGVDTDTMAKSIEKLSKSAFAAAIAPAGAVNAYTRLGIAVRDSEGHIRPINDLLLDVADKFSVMPDGVVKTALAMQLFGRGGAALIPVLDEGRKGIQEMLTTAQSLGLVISSDTAEGAHKLEQNLGILSATAEGFSNRLLTAMLPSLLAASTAMASFLESSSFQSKLGVVIDVLGTIAKWSIYVAETLFKLEEVNLELAKISVDAWRAIAGAAISGGEAIWKVAHGDFAGAKDEFKAGFAGLATPITNFIDSSKKTWHEYIDTIHSLSAPVPTAKTQRSGTSPDTTSKEGHRDIIAETIGQLRAQTSEEAALATAISDVTANTILATSAAQAEKTIIETNAKAKRENRSLTEDEKKTIRDLTLLQNSYKEGAKDNKGLEEFIQKTQLQTKSLQALGAAYSANLPVAIEQAREAEKLAPYGKQISDIEGVIAALRQMGASGAVLAPLLTSLAQLQQKFAQAQTSIHDLFAAEDTDKWAKALRDLQAQTDEMDAFIPAALRGAAALREFNVEQQTEKFARENPALSDKQIADYRRGLTALEQDKIAMAAADKVAANQSYLATQTQLSDLDLLRQKEVALGADTTATDLLIYQTKTKALTQYYEYAFQAQNAELLGNAKLYDVQVQLIKQWDEAQFKVGGFANRVKAVFNEIALQGRQAGSQIAQAFVSAFDGASSQLAHLIVTGKANFQNVLQGLQESIVKAGIQKAVGGLLGHIGLNLPGLTPGAQLGVDASHPMYVFAINGGSGIPGLPTPASTQTGIGSGPNLGGAQGGGIGMPNAGVFVQSLNTMSAAQNIFASKFNTSWLGIGANFLRHILSMTGLFHAHTAAVVAGQAVQTGAVAAGQAAQTAVTTAGATARAAVGSAEAKASVLRHAASAAAAVFHKVIEALPFPVNVILAPIAAAGTFAGVLAWGALAGSAAKGALLGEDMPIFAHAREMILPGDISEGLQGMIKSNQNAPSVPSVSQFGGSSAAGGNEFHGHVHMGDVSTVDKEGMEEVLRKGRSQILRDMRRAFQTGHLDVRRLARI